MQYTPPPVVTPLDDPVYPSSDGKRMADNTRQFEWIVALQGGIDAVVRADPAVLVAGDCLWYPVEGEPKIRTAPDTMVIFGRPKGYRGSYIQHREGGIAPQVVFEVLSPGNRAGAMRTKRAFYERYGVEEYYILDPDRARHQGFIREADKLVPLADLFECTSPRLGIRFEMTPQMKKVLRIIGPDGRPLEFYAGMVDRLDESIRRAEQERDRAEQERDRADEATLRAEQERLRAERLRAQLRALGMEPEG